jgi:hypothetical protein
MGRLRKYIGIALLSVMPVVLVTSYVTRGYAPEDGPALLAFPGAWVGWTLITWRSPRSDDAHERSEAQQRPVAWRRAAFLVAPLTAVGVLTVFIVSGFGVGILALFFGLGTAQAVRLIALRREPRW